MGKSQYQMGYEVAVKEIDSAITQAIEHHKDPQTVINEVILYLHTMRLRNHTPTDADTITYEDFCQYAGIPYIIEGGIA